MADSLVRLTDFLAVYNAQGAIDDRHFDSEFNQIFAWIAATLKTVSVEPTTLTKGYTELYVGPLSGTSPKIFAGDVNGTAIDILKDLRENVETISGAVGNIIPKGAILPFISSTPPSGFLECDGSAISRTTYADLFAVIGTNYGEGDGSTTFNIPDTRGKFLRGRDNSSGNDPDASSRTAQATGGNTGDNVGSIQADQIESHTHTLTSKLNGGSGSAGYPKDTTTDTTSSTNVGSTGGNETRPINVYVMHVIKY